MHFMGRGRLAPVVIFCHQKEYHGGETPPPHTAISGLLVAKNIIYRYLRHYILSGAIRNFNIENQRFTILNTLHLVELPL